MSKRFWFDKLFLVQSSFALQSVKFLIIIMQQIENSTFIKLSAEFERQITISLVLVGCISVAFNALLIFVILKTPKIRQKAGSFYNLAILEMSLVLGALMPILKLVKRVF